MSKYNTSSSDNFEKTPTGSHLARIYSIVDIGDQEYTNPQDGVTKVTRKIVYSFELVSELMKDGRPFVASKFYTASLHDKAALMIDLNNLRGKAMTQQDKDNFYDKKLMNIPCMVSIIHKAKADGNITAAISSLSPVPKGLEVPPLANETCYFDLDDQDEAEKQKIPDWIYQKINWNTAGISVSTPAAPVEDDEFDDIPF